VKRCRSAFWSKLVCFGAMLPTFSGCVVVSAIYMRNTSASTVEVLVIRKRGRHSVLEKKPSHFRYASRVLPRKQASIVELNDTLPVIATDTSFSFHLPAYSTVCIGGGQTSPFNEFKALRLQRADSSVQTIDSTHLTRSFHFKIFSGSFWYDIPDKDRK
jgi:hypothetical protein